MQVTAHPITSIAYPDLFVPQTVTQSTFASPCTMLASGIDSGFQPFDANAETVPQFSFVVNDACTPLWFYCKQGQ